MRQATPLVPTSRARRSEASLELAADTLVCFSHLRWNFVYQRPQHVLSRAAQTYRVLFLEEPVFAAGGLLPRLDLHRQSSGVTVAVPVLAHGTPEPEAVRAQRMMLDELLAGAAGRTVFWYYTPAAVGFSAHVKADLCVYDCMDELSAFAGAPAWLTERERELFARADLVFTGGQSLFEAKKRKHASVHAFPSSIDKAHFAQARREGLREPSDQARIDGPRVGFFGVVDERMDLELVACAAALRPAWQFVMIGPVVKIDAAALPQADNIHWLGARQYEQLPLYLSGWDAGFMPFALNEATRFISPTKTPEFLAAGVPVVSTAVRDVVKPYGEKDLVGIARSPEEMIEKLDAAMQRPYAPWLARADAFLSDMSWDRTWSAMAALMRSRLGDPARTRALVRVEAASGAAGPLHV